MDSICRKVLTLASDYVFIVGGARTVIQASFEYIHTSTTFPFCYKNRFHLFFLVSIFIFWLLSQVHKS